MIHATTIMSSMSQDQYHIVQGSRVPDQHDLDTDGLVLFTIIERRSSSYQQKCIIRIILPSEENSKFSLITTSRNLKTLPNDSQLHSLALDPRLRNPGRLRSVRYYRNFLVLWPYVPPKYSRYGDSPIRDTREDIARIPRSHELNST